MDTEKRELWDRLENEPERAYRAFECFLSLPSDHRTIVEAYRVYVGNSEAVKPSDTWTKPSSMGRNGVAKGIAKGRSPEGPLEAVLEAAKRLWACYKLEVMCTTLTYLSAAPPM
jgi:hypothetical protein